ncbi:hypothetical protein NDU88_008377 [Pleurodeles waltl]|uniref:Uncharacterized protein n=1 Tax=Pleurodeles waltl TaxID=8319 RepID=A0AAV7NVU6_PLEWA|nr:hypothetical protein NDU88_008377 [Pleurodeles waltl]
MVRKAYYTSDERERSNPHGETALCKSSAPAIQSETNYKAELTPCRGPLSACSPPPRQGTSWSMPCTHSNARRCTEATATLPVPTAPCHHWPFRSPCRARAEELTASRSEPAAASLLRRTRQPPRRRGEPDDAFETPVAGDSGERPAPFSPKVRTRGVSTPVPVRGGSATCLV